MKILSAGDGLVTFLQKVWCRLGNIHFLGRTVSSTRCHCILPLVQHGLQSLHLSTNQVDFAIVGELNINYHPNNVGEVANETCPELPERGAHAQVPMINSFSGGKNEHGFAAVSFGLNADLFSSRRCVDLVFLNRPFINVVHPPSGFQGDNAIVHVAGKDFVIPNGNTLDCLLGNARQSAVLISSSLIICEVTFAAKLDAVAMDTSLALHQLVKAQVSVAQFIYVSKPKPLDLLPLAGPSRGGTVTHVYGSGFTSAEFLTCKFGSFLVYATFISGFEITCVSPSHKQGEIPFRIALHGREMAGGNDVFRVTN